MDPPPLCQSMRMCGRPPWACLGCHFGLFLYQLDANVVSNHPTVVLSSLLQTQTLKKQQKQYCFLAFSADHQYTHGCLLGVFFDLLGSTLQQFSSTLPPKVVVWLTFLVWIDIPRITFLIPGCHSGHFVLQRDVNVGSERPKGYPQYTKMVPVGRLECLPAPGDISRHQAPLWSWARASA